MNDYVGRHRMPEDAAQHRTEPAAHAVRAHWWEHFQLFTHGQNPLSTPTEENHDQHR